MKRNRIYIKDKMELSTFGLLDKTIMQSRTAKSLILFINYLMQGRQTTAKKREEANEVTKYWKDCTDISNKKKEINWKHVEKMERETNGHKKS